MLEGWLRGDKDLTEGEGTEGDRGLAAPGSRQNSPAEVSSAWCAVLHLRLTLENRLLATVSFPKTKFDDALKT